jgi:hypothetical protein
MSDSASPAAPYEVAARFATEDEAHAAVETLILRGLGAMAKPCPDGEAGFDVLVVPGETPHAAEILGLPVEDAPEPRRGGRRQVLSVLAIFGVALVVLPVVAFFVSFKLSGG